MSKAEPGRDQDELGAELQAEELQAEELQAEDLQAEDRCPSLTQLNSSNFVSQSLAAGADDNEADLQSLWLVSFV
ncbi:uncharacterized protein V6R79_000061 [Siganus canaliculatus]